MSNENLSLNKTLINQLKKYDFTLNELPKNLDQWQQFIERINNAYADSQQEQYILERSSEIASRETEELYKKLEKAQHLARIAHWQYNKENEKFIFSKEFVSLFGFDNSILSCNLDALSTLLHEQDRMLFLETIEKALQINQDAECEIRITKPDKSLLWLYIICRPLEATNKENSEKTKDINLAGIAMDITKRKEAEEKIEVLNKQLLSSARSAGMAEVATAILHNIGNILNSANVSLGILKENVSEPHFDKLLTAISYMEEHISSIDTYLTQDEKGKLIPKYLVAVGKVIKNGHETARKEIDNLITHINHIKEIVAMQQSFSSSSIMTEKIFLPEAIELSLQMSLRKFRAHNIRINKEYNNIDFIVTDKAKLLQILVNLIQNALDAVVENKKHLEKEITITTQAVKEKNLINIIIKDNGIGIPVENITKIFGFGYTSKHNGHGYGLHTSALFAKEMGGALQANSEGNNLGAEFILSLPINKNTERKAI